MMQVYNSLFCVVMVLSSHVQALVCAHTYDCVGVLHQRQQITDISALRIQMVQHVLRVAQNKYFRTCLHSLTFATLLSFAYF